MGSEIKDRIKQITKTLNISARSFSIKIGKDPTYVNGIKNDISSEVLKNIHTTFPSINILWIITGEGKILLETPDESMIDINPTMLLTMFKDKDDTCTRLQKEKELLMDQNHKLEKEVQSLKIALGIEEIPKSKVG